MQREKERDERARGYEHDTQTRNPHHHYQTHGINAILSAIGSLGVWSVGVTSNAIMQNVIPSDNRPIANANSSILNVENKENYCNN